jgi:hypothetical protein
MLRILRRAAFAIEESATLLVGFIPFSQSVFREEDEDYVPIDSRENNFICEQEVRVYSACLNVYDCTGHPRLGGKQIKR